MTHAQTLEVLFGSQPWFGGNTHGRQTSQFQNISLTALVFQMVASGGPVRILEVGAWAGFTTLTFAYAIDGFSPEGGEVVSIDPFEAYLSPIDLAKEVVTYPAYRSMESMLGSGLAYDLFLHNIGCGPKRIPIRHIRARSHAAMADMTPASFDLIYIDGSHYYHDVAGDIRAAMRLIKEGGIIAGDDLNIQLPDIAEETVRQHLSEDCVVRSDGSSFHPGVTLAVAEIFGRVAQVDQCWAVQKTSRGFVEADFRRGKILIPEHFTREMKEEIQRALQG